MGLQIFVKVIQVWRKIDSQDKAVPSISLKMDALLGYSFAGMQAK